MHSQDRRYWWDGSSWRLAVSANGRLWFDGREWVSNPLRPPVRRRVSKRWTHPLQWLVVIVAVLSFALMIAEISFTLSMISAIPQTLPEGITPAEAELWLRVTLIAMGLIAFGLLILVVVGALRRWTWAFWLALVLNGLGTVLIVLSFVFGLLALVGVTFPGPSGAERRRIFLTPLPHPAHRGGRICTASVQSRPHAGGQVTRSGRYPMITRRAIALRSGPIWSAIGASASSRGRR